MKKNMIDKMLKIRAHAKINLSLDVVGSRADGYHDLDMIMASISIFDQLECLLSKDIIVDMYTSAEQTWQRSCGEWNIAYRAIAKCVELGLVEGMRVKITKNIPISSGLGGSSADAAGVLRAVKTYTDCDDSVIEDIGRQLGSDVVFMYHGGVARAQGRGDILTPYPFRKIDLLIAVCEGGALTKTVFELRKADNAPETNYTKRMIERGSFDENMFGNSLTKYAILVNSGIARSLDTLVRECGNGHMTGSGSGVFAICDSLQSAEQFKEHLKKEIYILDVATTVPKGSEVVSITKVNQKN